MDETQLFTSSAHKVMEEKKKKVKDLLELQGGEVSAPQNLLGRGLRTFS